MSCRCGCLCSFGKARRDERGILLSFFPTHYPKNIACAYRSRKSKFLFMQLSRVCQGSDDQEYPGTHGLNTIPNITWYSQEPNQTGMEEINRNNTEKLRRQLWWLNREAKSCSVQRAAVKREDCRKRQSSWSRSFPSCRIFKDQTSKEERGKLSPQPDQQFGSCTMEPASILRAANSFSLPCMLFHVPAASILPLDFIRWRLQSSVCCWETHTFSRPESIQCSKGRTQPNGAPDPDPILEGSLSRTDKFSFCPVISFFFCSFPLWVVGGYKLMLNFDGKVSGLRPAAAHFWSRASLSSIQDPGAIKCVPPGLWEDCIQLKLRRSAHFRLSVSGSWWFFLPVKR